MIHRTLNAHETILEKVRKGIDKTEKSGDWGSNDLLMSEVLRRHELQVWFIAEHVVDVPWSKADIPAQREAVRTQASSVGRAPGARGGV